MYVAQSIKTNNSIDFTLIMAKKGWVIYSVFEKGIENWTSKLSLSSKIL